MIFSDCNGEGDEGQWLILKRFVYGLSPIHFFKAISIKETCSNMQTKKKFVSNFGKSRYPFFKRKGDIITIEAKYVYSDIPNKVFSSLFCFLAIHLCDMDPSQITEDENGVHFFCPLYRNEGEAPTTMAQLSMKMSDSEAMRLIAEQAKKK